MINLPNFKLDFIDDTFFEGQMVVDDWSKAPDKLIKSMTFIYGNVKLYMEGYKQYIQLGEMTYIGGKGTKISHLFVIGRKENNSDLFHFDLAKSSCKRHTVPLYHELGDKIISQWKDGLLTTPRFEYR